MSGPEIWKDANKPTDQRVQDLVRRMTLEEKVSQIMANPPGIPRLGIRDYSHRNEALHGVANGVATVFPQAIGMAATWNVPLIQQEADVISTEGRAKSNDYASKHEGNIGQHSGINFYSPNINIFRDPRWGRGQETYGEDPFLTAQIGVAFVKGLQGDDPKYIKTMACAKHYVVHSGPEKQRHHMSMDPPQRDLYETYLPAFEALIKDAKAGTVMGAYSALYKIPCCANKWLLTDLLRDQWGFDGLVFSDGGAIGDIWAEHKYVPGPTEAAAAAVRAGCDVSSGGMQVDGSEVTKPGHQNYGIKGGRGFQPLPDAVKKGLITEKEIDQAVTRELTMRFRMGMFDPREMVKWSRIGIDQNDTPEHRKLALKVAQESMVLLKNDGILPLDKSKYKTVAVIGPNADAPDMQTGNYSGKSSRTVTILQGIKDAAGKDVKVVYEQGSRRTRKRDGSDPQPPEMMTKAVDVAKGADLVIFVSGIDAGLEKEEGSAKTDVYEGFSRGDRTRIELPQVQEELLAKLHATGKPVVVVNCSGSAMAMPWAQKNLPAILQAWYPGEEGGTAVADILFGKYNPAGRLPVTFYAKTDDLPKFEDYSMKNRTYRYFNGKPLYAFGYGFSYTKFEYADAKLAAGSIGAGDTIKLSFTVKNTGAKDGDEVPQVYFRHVKSAVPQAKLTLCDFRRVHVKAGESSQVSLEIPAQRFRYWDENKKAYTVEAGEYQLLIGGSSDDHRLTQKLTIKG
ncbi:MAG TPA: glycoside hydrolase family 3 C-terminal domain-containing protein [Tepidisphaeraceae bacterium]